MDVEKVKYSIERCISHVPDACRDCAYDAGHPYNECVEMMLKDTLELLKKQKEAALWKRRAIEGAEEACYKCDYRYGGVFCNSCRMKTIREAGEVNDCD